MSYCVVCLDKNKLCVYCYACTFRVFRYERVLSYLSEKNRLQVLLIVSEKQEEGTHWPLPAVFWTATSEKHLYQRASTCCALSRRQEAKKLHQTWRQKFTFISNVLIGVRLSYQGCIYLLVSCYCVCLLVCGIEFYHISVLFMYYLGILREILFNKHSVVVPFKAHL